MTSAVVQRRLTGQQGLLNTRHHKAVLMVFLLVVIAHWVEHLAQAVQVYLLGWPRPEAGGALGLVFPVLVSSEWLHYGFAVVMMVAFVMLRHGFTGRSRTWWNVAMWIQVWHHFEHLLLLLQAVTGTNLVGSPQPVSVVQLLISRVELHLFYNAVVFVPMVVAMIVHLRPRPEEHQQPSCSCVRVPAAASR